jgi:hypothetical protein
MPQPWQAIAQRFCSITVCLADKSGIMEWKNSNEEIFVANYYVGGI